MTTETESVKTERNILKSCQNKESLNEILRHYLRVLSKWQLEVEHIRIMHHDVWKESRVFQIIKQHRAGSRVERYTRILPFGKRTDVDYKFEVVGITIETTDSSNKRMYWKPSESSPAYGRVYVTSSYKDELCDSVQYSGIFGNDTFLFDPEEKAYLVLPQIFKNNVIQISCFPYKKRPQRLERSPSVPGNGEMNEYDIVPCLRMAEWPREIVSLFKRCKSKSLIFNNEWHHSICRQPIFVVATGNPSSSAWDYEFRLSFSLTEVQCFLDIPDYAGQLYGFLKYVFKIGLEPIDLLDSYHLKTLFLWSIERTTDNDLQSVQPLQFVLSLLSDVQTAVQSETVSHFFVHNCNIFPFHKKDVVRKKVLYEEFFSCLETRVEEISVSLIQMDLRLSNGTSFNEQIIEAILEEFCKQERIQDFIDAYLTRLLSVTTFSLYQNDQSGTLSKVVDHIAGLFRHYSSIDKHIPRIIPMINSTLSWLTKNKCVHIEKSDYDEDLDKVSVLVHDAFEAYVKGDHRHTQTMVERVANIVSTRTEATRLGISVTSYHKSPSLDGPLLFVIRALEERSHNGICPRFYVDPLVLMYHMQIQLGICDIQATLEKMEVQTMVLPNHVPYKGKLSYQFAAAYLLHGYKNCDAFHQYKITIPDIYGLDYFDDMKPTNFEMR